MPILFFHRQIINGYGEIWEIGEIGEIVEIGEIGETGETGKIWEMGGDG